MTQEELDALMAQDLSDEEAGGGEAGAEAGSDDDEESFGDPQSPDDFRVSTESQWPPPPPTTEHKVVHQLDEVTKDTELKAGQVFDVLEAIGADAMETEEIARDARGSMESIRDTLEKLQQNFPNIESFSRELVNCNAAIEKMDLIVEKAQNSNDQTMVAMDIMQYQDIHRQKIERVINVMRALSRYMSSLFEGQIADEKRVSSAVHLAGDATEDLVGEDDIEALIAAFGSK